jgi:hypothetical protein
MARDSEVPPSCGAPRSAASPRPEEQPHAGEQYGILLVDRHRKDDGRALLLYKREEPDGR